MAYRTRREINYSFWLRKVRCIPDDDPYLPPELHNFIYMLEEHYYTGKLHYIPAIKRYKFFVLASLLREAFGVRFTIIDDYNAVILPRSYYIYDKFVEYPQIVSIIGNRNSGKTITGWTLAYRIMSIYRDMELWLYGDADGLGDILKDEEPFTDRVVIKEDYKLPPVDGKKRLVFFNELSEELLTVSTYTKEGKDLKINAFRTRHKNCWVIYNVIRYRDLQTTLRETSDLKIYKWMTAEMLQSTIDLLPEAYGEIVKLVTELPVNEGIAYVPVQGKGDYFHILCINPPQIILDAAGKAKKNLRIMMSKTERERKYREKILEVIVKKREEGWSYARIAEYLREHYDFEKGFKTVERMYKRYISSRGEN